MTTPEDLDLLAQSYVLGELDADETARFERRLAGDQHAREAVGRAAALVEALDRGVAPAARRPRWSYAAAAAALLIAAIGIVITLGNGRTTREAEQLIEAWVAFGSDEELDELDDALEADPLDEPLAPGWLLTALEERER